MKKSYTINDLSKEERPREKLISSGAHKLSDRELLVILLGRGISGESVIITAERLWGHFKSLEGILNASINDLSKIRGIGPAKASQIKATFEISKRVNIKEKRKSPEPFIKWAGGKSQLLKQYSAFFPLKFNKYFEPFVGGGAVFFYLKPQKAFISDSNNDLINTYLVIKKNVTKLIEILKEYNLQHKKDFFYKIRDNYNAQILNNIERAAAFIYLNKAGFNGLHRVNSSGNFNVPFGNHKTPLIYNEENLKAVSNLLKSTDLNTMSFEKVLDHTEKGDLIYFDPPYYPLNKNSFTSYTKNNFLEKEQEKLLDVFNKLDKKGCKIMLSNSDTELIRNLYKKYRIETVKANRFINCNGEKRGAITELLILNY